MGIGGWGWALGLSVALAGCGAGFNSAECQRTYDDCASDCAEVCDDRGPAAETTEPETVNTWSMACSACEDRCRGQARACDERAARRVTP